MLALSLKWRLLLTISTLVTILCGGFAYLLLSPPTHAQLPEHISEQVLLIWLIGLLLGGLLTWRLQRQLSAALTLEHHLRHSEENFKRAQAVAHVGSWSIDIRSGQLDWSDEVYRIFGLPVGCPVSFDHFLACLHPDDRDSVATAWQSALISGEYDIEHRLLINHQIRWVRERAKVEFNDAGQPITGIGTVQDISQRKQTELQLAAYRADLERMVQTRTQALETSNQRLQRSESRLSAMLAMSQKAHELDEKQLLQLGLEEAVRLTDSDIGYLHFVNPDQETLGLYTWSANTLRYCTATHDSHYPVADAGIWADTVRLKRPVVHNDYQNLPNRAGYPAGHAHLVRHLGVPVIEGESVVLLLGVGNKAVDYDDSDVNQLQLIGHDLWSIVTRRRATAALAEAREIAEAASRAKTTFLANMSHELRTPMNAIMGMTQLALHQATDAKILDQLGKIDAASAHLLAIINDILDISQIEAEHLQLACVDFKLAEVLQNLYNLLGPKAADKGLRLLIQPAPELAQISLHGDPVRLEQILLNLTNNAIKFSDQGSIVLSIQPVVSANVQPRLHFEIQDNGIGIAAENLTRLFTAFEQADSSMTRKYGGTGLGLAISKRLVQLMSGEIGVDSRPGAGSRFWFEIPWLASNPSTLPAVTSPTDGALHEQLKTHYSGRLILVVEDEPVNQEVSRWMLEEAGLTVSIAEDGWIAVEMVQHQHFDLILMDVQMPNLNGMDATRMIRGLPGYGYTPIIAMTASAFNEDRQACLDAGMNDHIGKPVDQQALYQLLLTWLQTRQC